MVVILRSIGMSCIPTVYLMLRRLLALARLLAHVQRRFEVARQWWRWVVWRRWRWIALPCLDLKRIRVGVRVRFRRVVGVRVIVSARMRDEGQGQGIRVSGYQGKGQGKSQVEG